MMWRFVYLTVFSFLAFCSKDLMAQYQISHFTTENGLPSNGIKGLQLDESTGFLWLATEAGLVRYDGINFTAFNNSSNPELGSNRVIFLLRNEKGAIYSGGQSGNLVKIEENEVKLHVRGAEVAHYNFNHYCAISAADPLFKKCFEQPWPTGEFSIFNTELLPVSDTSCMVFASGKVYSYSMNAGAPAILPAIPQNIKYAFKIEKSICLIDSAHQLYTFNNDGLQKVLMLDENGKSFNLEMKNSNLFWTVGMSSPVIIQKGNAWIFQQLKNGHIESKLIATGIPENVFYNYAQFRNNGDDLFLSSASKGLYVIHKNQLVSKTGQLTDINQTNAQYSQIELPNGNVLTNNGHQFGDITSTDNYNIGNYFLNSVFQMNDSILLFGRRDSFYLYNRNTYSRKLFLHFKSNESFVFAKTDGKLFVASQQGIGKVDGDSIQFLRRFDEKADFGLDVKDVKEFGPHELLIASCSGLLKFNTETRYLDTLLKIPSICIRTLYREGDYFFIGTYGGGYYLMKNGVVKKMPVDVNQYLNYSHCFMKDSMGYCWISTNNGLFKAKMSDIIRAYEDNVQRVYYHYLGKYEGMQTTELNGGCTPCALQLRSGDFSFPTMDGLISFNPLKTNISLPTGKMYIDRIAVDGVPYRNKKDMEFPSDVNIIEIDLALNAWCGKENLYVDYKLDDGPWLAVEFNSNAVNINLSNLNYGSHKLELRKLNGFGPDNYFYTSLDFSVATPFYHQWYFRVLVLLLLFALVYLIFKVRLKDYAAREKKLSAMVEQKTMDLNEKNKELERKDQIKTRLISIINHDIMTPLKFMHYAGTALLEDDEKMERDQQKETIREITQTAKDMEMLSSQILNWIIYHDPNQRMEKEDFDLHQLVDMVFRVLLFTAKQKGTILKNDLPKSFVVYQHLEPLRVMIYNLVTNSLNFTREGIIVVRCLRIGNEIKLEVEDSGVGMTEEQIANLLSDEKIISSVTLDNKKGTGLGYLIIKDLIKMMQGRLEIQSVKQKGTLVSIFLPDDRAEDDDEDEKGKVINLADFE